MKVSDIAWGRLDTGDLFYCIKDHVGGLCRGCCPHCLLSRDTEGSQLLEMNWPSHFSTIWPLYIWTDWRGWIWTAVVIYQEHLDFRWMCRQLNRDISHLYKDSMLLLAYQKQFDINDILQILQLFGDHINMLLTPPLRRRWWLLLLMITLKKMVEVMDISRGRNNSLKDRPKCAKWCCLLSHASETKYLIIIMLMCASMTMGVIRPKSTLTEWIICHDPTLHQCRMNH